MAANNLIDHYDRRALMDVAEELKQPTTFLVDTVWNDLNEFATSAVDLDIYEGKRRVAPGSNRNEEGPQVDKLGYSTRTFTPSVYKPKITITGDDILKRAPGGQLYDNAGNLAPAVRDFVARQINDLDEMITRAEELQAKQALFDGTITIYDKDGGTVQTVDMQRNANLTYNVGTVWSNSAADKLADLRQARRNVQQYSGFTPRTVLMGYEAADEFLSDTSIQSALSKDWSRRGELAYDMRDNGGIWMGFVDGFDIWTYDGYIINPANSTEELIVPSKKVLVFAEQATQTRLYGAITAADNDGNLIVESTARYIDMYPADRDPAGTIVQVQSAPLMGLNYPNAQAVLTVLGF